MMDDNMREKLLQSLGLKSLKRAGWVRAKVDEVESVAAHSWGVAWLAMLLCPEELNRERVLCMAIVHDLAEVIAGDITPYDGVSHEDKVLRERIALREITESLPRSDEVLALQKEYQECATPEAIFVHKCDKLDMMLQAERYMADCPEVNLEEFVFSARRGLSELDRLSSGNN